MGKVAIVTDSSACIPDRLVQKYSIQIVPLQIAFGNRVFKDGVDLTQRQFFQMLRNEHLVPTTSSPTPGEFLKHFTNLAPSNEAILCLCPPPALSAIYNAARAAKDTVPDLPVQIIPLPTAASGQGLVVLAAARAAQTGQGLKEVLKIIEDVAPRVRLFGIVDTLEYLRRGGRVAAVSALAASLLSVKPIFRFQDGKADLVATTRTKPRAVERLLKTIANGVKPGALLHLAIFHADAADEAERLKAKLVSSYNCAELLVTEFTPVMGAHTGPGLLGLAFYSES